MNREVINQDQQLNKQISEEIESDNDKSNSKQIITPTSNINNNAENNKDAIKYTLNLLKVDDNFYVIGDIIQEVIKAEDIEKLIGNNKPFKKGGDTLPIEKDGGKKTETKKYHKPYPKNVTFSKKFPKKKHNKKTIRKLQNALNNMLL